MLGNVVERVERRLWDGDIARLLDEDLKKRFSSAIEECLLPAAAKEVELSLPCFPTRDVRERCEWRGFSFLRSALLVLVLPVPDLPKMNRASISWRFLFGGGLLLRAYGSSNSPAGVKGLEGGYHGVVAPEPGGDAFELLSIGLPSREGILSVGPIWNDGFPL